MPDAQLVEAEIKVDQHLRMRSADVGGAIDLVIKTAKPDWSEGRDRASGRRGTYDIGGETVPIFFASMEGLMGKIVELPYADVPDSRYYEVTDPSASAINARDAGGSVYVNLIPLTPEEAGEMEKSGRLIRFDKLQLSEDTNARLHRVNS